MAPKNFQSIANSLVQNGPYRDVEKLWAAVQRKNYELAVRLRSLRNEQAPPNDIVDLVKRCHESLRKGGSNRCHRSAKGQ